MSLFKKLFGGKEKSPFPETTGTGGANNEAFDAMVKELIEEEKKKMDAMSRLELIEYAAETRINLMYAFTLLKELAPVIQDIQKVNAVTVATLNNVIRKKSAKPIDLSKL